MSVTLSPGQEKARSIVHKLLDQGQAVVSLSGAAGTGKTTILRVLLADLEGTRKVRLYAPTGKAALRMTEATGRQAHTIHSGLYGVVMEGDDGQPVFAKPGKLCGPGDLVIVDEFSMVGRKLFADMREHLPHGAQVLAVGDYAQLRPVRDKAAVDLAYADAKLTEVHRQAAENPILALATAMRQGHGADWLGGYGNDDPRLVVMRGTPMDAAKRLPEGDATLLAYTNPERQGLNTIRRHMIGLHGPVTVGDKLLVRANRFSAGVCNGEVLSVVGAESFRSMQLPGGSLQEWEVRAAGKPTVYRIYPALFNVTSSEWYDATGEAPRGSRGARGADSVAPIHCTYGQCLTVHSSQGSEWDHVVGYVGAPMRRRAGDEYRRLAYTMITRAAKTLTLVVGG